jgi:hypothetical protein
MIDVTLGFHAEPGCTQSGDPIIVCTNCDTIQRRLTHESVETAQIYTHADMRLKEKALARVAATKTRPTRYRSDDALLAFLESTSVAPLSS